MSANPPTVDNPLESAASQLRDLCRDRERITSSFDADSVQRMLVHIGNINRSVLASTQDHVNAAKRLNDFALTLIRIGKTFEPPNGALAVRMVSAANDLRAASEELAATDGIPNWQAPVSG